MAETVLVTGGTGFIGGWCIVELLKRGYAVRTTVRNSAKETALRRALASAIDPALCPDSRLTFFIADLTKDTGWDDAAAGCDYVLHVASPLIADAPSDPNAFIVPAREGSLRVLRAATKAAVKRVVMTSSVAACSPSPLSPDNVDNDETVWTNPSEKNLHAYRKSKVLAERAAWEFIAGSNSPTTLTTILPGAVLGPVLTMENLGSVQVVERLLTGKLPGNPRLGFNIVDVRDVADAHIRAMTSPQAAGQRFIAAGDFLWMKEISKTLRATLGDRARKVPARGLPDFVLRFASIFDRPLRMVTPGLGRKHTFTSAKLQQVLNWKPRPVNTTVIECAESLLAGTRA
jgi:dihydroflavonol-4-reductase